MWWHASLQFTLIPMEVCILRTPIVSHVLMFNAGKLYSLIVANDCVFGKEKRNELKHVIWSLDVLYMYINSCQTSKGKPLINKSGWNKSSTACQLPMMVPLEIYSFSKPAKWNLIWFSHPALHVSPTSQFLVAQLIPMHTWYHYDIAHWRCCVVHALS